MLKGFKEFISRGNIIELAVAVVIGTAFTAIVTAFTNGIVKPFINALGGTEVAEGLGFHVLPGKESSFVDLGTAINSVINFLLIAVIVYLVFVLPMNKLQERRRRGEAPAPAEPTEVELLKEIRDLLEQLPAVQAAANAHRPEETDAHQR